MREAEAGGEAGGGDARREREAAAGGFRVVLTTDHGSIHCMHPTTVFARKDATQNLRYKFGGDLRAEDPTTVMTTSDAMDLRQNDPTMEKIVADYVAILAATNPSQVIEIGAGAGAVHGGVRRLGAP
mgnify:CR=1 FL=1